MMGDVQDVAYARRLFAILTNPHPTGVDPDDPYGQADDGIDRYDGFGRDVWVKSLEVAEASMARNSWSSSGWRFRRVRTGKVSRYTDRSGFPSMRSGGS
jgi:hypothetical protein